LVFFDKRELKIGARRSDAPYQGGSAKMRIAAPDLLEVSDRE